MNAWIALTRSDPTFSHTLAELEYGCDVIEPPIFVEDHDLHPDIVLTSVRHANSLVVDCKSNTVEPDQLERYQALKGREDALVAQGIVRDVAADDLSAELTLSSFTDLSNDNYIPDPFALVHFRHDPSSGFSVWNLDGHEFTFDALRELFPINGEPSQPLPVSYYPYDVYEEDRRTFVTHILRSVISLAVKQGEFSAEDVVRDSHQYWEALSNEKQKQLLREAKQTIYELQEAGLDDHIEVIAETDGTEWKRISKSIQAVSDKTDYYVDRVTEALDQQTFGDYNFDI
ncbi:hypothetical protein [Salinirubellus litoreus]